MMRYFALFATLLLAFAASAQDVEHRISMTMKDADLADVMDMISREQRVNVFVSTESAETVSFSLYDMTVPEAIRAIANAAGMAVEYYDGNYFVVDRDDAGKYEPDALTQVRVFELQYVSVEEVQSLLQPYLSEWGEITTFEDRNLFMVEDTPGFLRRIAALKRQTDTMHRLAITDSLTHVYNRRYLLDHGEQFLASRNNHPVAAVLMDIDHFKKINDNLGHITGDRVLEALGEMLLDRLPPNAMAVRFGGEEFALLVPRCHLDDAETCAEGLRTEVEALNPANVSVTVSIGLATNQQNPEMTLTQLLNHADKALYAAKAQGRNRVCA